MTQTPSYSDLTPLRSDTDVEKRVRGLIGQANIRQLWLMFLDDDDVQLPLLMPIDGLPQRPETDDITLVAGNIRDTMDHIGARFLIVVWERYGPAHLSEDDTVWVRAIASACGAVRLRLRAILLAHRDGVRWIAADDYIS